ncbi:fructosamine kinase family protein [Methyloversatilis thermotolerans]|uniref:fructosamine kinase family protein n=1 Tax=Methyloversatilis thermotolerans TaxID=1346290 RepID=UPI00035E013D|nr:fructosamine kinase family protein [Methyloversatilis thermotolerans]
MNRLAHEICAALGTSAVEVTELPAVGARRALRILSADAPLFVKSRPAAQADLFAAEAEGLAMLTDAGRFRVPRVFGQGKHGNDAWLALEWLDLTPLRSHDDGVLFGDALAGLHARHGERYGLARDNWLGDSLQENGWAASWPLFYAQRRIAPQIARLIENGERGELLRTLQALIERIPALFLDYRPAASLLHGDLWHGNAGMVDGRPAIFDPAVHFGDRESDYAMTELFGGFPLSTYASYQKAAPLDPGAASRRDLYRLYHLLNHLLLFGEAYRRETARTAARLLSSLR